LAKSDNLHHDFFKAFLIRIEDQVFILQELLWLQHKPFSVLQQVDATVVAICLLRNVQSIRKAGKAMFLGFWIFTLAQALIEEHIHHKI